MVDCKGLTVKGLPCKNKIKSGEYCIKHLDQRTTIIPTEKIHPRNEKIQTPVVLSSANSTCLGSLSISIAPGRADWQRNLPNDLSQLKEEGFNVIVCLQEHKELNELKMFGYPIIAQKQGFLFLHLPIVDRRAASLENTIALVENIVELLEDGEKIYMHCKGGLGRSGTVAACVALHFGIKHTEVIDFIRKNRPGAIQTNSQKQLIQDYIQYIIKL